MKTSLKLRKQTMIDVPFTRKNNLSNLILIITTHLLTLILTSIILVNCESQYLNRPLTSQYYDDYYFDNYLEDSIANSQQISDYYQQHRGKTNLASEPTPPLEFVHQYPSKPENHHNHDEDQDERFTQKSGHKHHNSLKNNDVLPAKVRLARQGNLFSPIFNSQLLNQNILDTNDIYQAAQTSLPQLLNPSDTSNSFELIEPGSGNEWDNNQPLDDTTNMMEDSTTVMNEYDASSQPTPVVPTPVLTPNFNQFSTSSSPSDDVGDGYNRAPLLNRRLPKLSVTAGQFWKYMIPFDTFIDEDGDLRQLKSAILSKDLIKPNQGNNQNKIDMNLEEVDGGRQTIGQYYSWLQYDQPSQLLYGLPTEKDVGPHKLMLVVSDHLGATIDETIEINIKPHQSIRAFTHLFVINGIEWNRQRYTSMIDAIGELIRRISTRVYLDEPLKNLVVQNFTVNNLDVMNLNNNSESDLGKSDLTLDDRSSSGMSFTISWSNSSIPIHPCNISQLDSLARMLVDTRELDVGWSLDRGSIFEFQPSQNLLRALRPEFKPTNVSIILQGSCEGRGSSVGGGQSNSVQPIHDTSDLSTKVNVKIGKLTWKLGEPIEYQIPADTFTTERGTSITRELLLTMHTIDGIIFNNDPRYSFLEFDQDSQTLYGLSYDQAAHSGQREILLTARHPRSGEKIREVFIVNIEPQDLTTINNRAFQVSLYLFTRSGLFGPRERVALSHKIAGALGLGKQEFDHDRENPEMIIMDIQKFALKGVYMNNSAAFLEPESYLDKIIRIPDNNNNNGRGDELQLDSDGTTQSIFFYKYIWTNGTIGYRGDCPVEVINQNVLSALEQSMVELRVPANIYPEQATKNDSIRFFNNLRIYFEPESDLIHLRFDPLGACVNVLETHDVGNGDVADRADRVGESPPLEQLLEVTTPQTVPVTPKVELEANNDEYWAIIVLIILVVALIFVIIMFFMGMHTYKINQDKRFELQVKLAQARQNSMYLSSMILANQATSSDICNSMMAQGLTKSMYVVQDEEKGSRKPVILDNEKQLFHNNPTNNLQPTAVQLTGQTVHTMPMKPDMSFTLDTVAANGHWQPTSTMTQSPSRMMQNYMNERQRSMTLNHRSSNSSIQRLATNEQPLINHSQSILTVASLAGPLPMIPQGRAMPVVYAQVPIANGGGGGLIEQQNPHYFSLQRSYSQQQRASDLSLANRMSQMRQASYAADSFDELSKTAANNYPPPAQATKLPANNHMGGAQNKIRSPSYSSSNSATTSQSVISNPNYVQRAN